MLKYKKFKNLAKQFQINTTNNGFELAKQLTLEIKTEKELLKELDSEQSLLNGNAALLIIIDRFIICYNPDDTYMNYYIVHECSHYILKHNDDIQNNENEADLLACLILAKPQSLIEHNFYTAESISKMYNIPINKAELYIDTLLKNDEEYKSAFYTYFNTKKGSKHLNKKYRLFHLLYIIVVIVLFVLFVKSACINEVNQEVLKQKEPISEFIISTEITTESTITQEITVLQPTEQQQTTLQPTALQSNKTVKVTKFGKKYHLPNCRYVDNKSTTIEMDIKKAQELGYEPCAVCHPE